jgi:AraC family transcriptional regulator of adaptative response/methylated-DNA-[protein]-cysteine methyltransferase
VSPAPACFADLPALRESQKPENCRFYFAIAECLEAGYRPCKRCTSLVAEGENDPTVHKLLEALDADPARRWHESDLERMGVDPSTARRAFKRRFGVIFLEFARLSRLRSGAKALRDGKAVIAAQIDAGFESGSGFRAAFARFLGVAPSSLRKDALLKTDWIDTPLGPMIAVADNHALHPLEFHDRKALARELKALHERSPGRIGFGRPAPIDQVAGELAACFDGRDAVFRTPLALTASAVTRAVWDALREIPPCETRSYSQIAQDIAKPGAVRAVARANGVNQIAILVPCHRVIGADGSLAGYGGGLWRKQKLIETELKYRVGTLSRSR